MARGRVAVVGAGPNGLTAAAVLARAGHDVTVYERMEEPGGGTRTMELTLPGFLHDVCSAVHPMGAASPAFRDLDLLGHGLEWVHPDAPLAHPFDDGTAAILERDVEETARTLGARDAAAYTRLMQPLVDGWEELAKDTLAPLRPPRHPVVLARFGLSALRSALGLARSRFEEDRARALFCGIAAHVLLPLDRSPSAAFGLMLAAAGHAVGWPVARGGSQRIADALARVIRGHGGAIVTGRTIASLDELEDADAVLLDLTPRQVLRVGGERLPALYRRRLERYRYSFGVFKVDWALSEPIPWRAPECARAGTVHLGATTAEIAASARAADRGLPDERPFVLLAQPTLFDRTRAPDGRHVAWAYCHVPHGSTGDRTAAIEAQVERFAPGFRDTILARSTKNAAEMEAHNPNLVGGDINGGVQDLAQLFFRPVARPVPYTTPLDGVYLCSSSTPPGGAVHGMCGWFAAEAALRGLR